MIKPTRITVDQATREVLEKLSTQLAQAPAWTATLSDNIQDGFREGTRQSQTATNRLLEPLAAASRTLQGQLAEQATRLATLLDLVQVVEARLTAQQQGMPEAVQQQLQDAERRQHDSHAEQVQVLTALSASVQALEPRVVAQQETLEAQQQDLVKLLSSEEQTRAAVTKHHVMLEAVQHLLQNAEERQRDSQAEQVQVLAALSASVQALEPRAVAQQGALEAQQQDLVKLLNVEEQTRAAVAKHHAMLEAVQHLLEDAERRQHDSQAEQVQVLAALSASVQALEPRAVAQQGALEAQQQDLVKLLSVEEQTRAAVTKHHVMLEAVQHLLQNAEQHQRDSQAEQAQAQAVTHDLLREMQAEQARQLNELRSICRRLDMLSTPWWKKLFKRNRSQNS